MSLWSNQMLDALQSGELTDIEKVHDDVVAVRTTNRPWGAFTLFAWLTSQETAESWYSILNTVRTFCCIHQLEKNQLVEAEYTAAKAAFISMQWPDSYKSRYKLTEKGKRLLNKIQQRTAQQKYLTCSVLT